MDIMTFKDVARSVAEEARRLGASFADLRITRSGTTSARVQDRRADRLHRDVSMGAGLRVLVDEAWGFAATDVLTREALVKSLQSAVAMARASAEHVLDKGTVASVAPVEACERVEVRLDPRSVSPADKMTALLALEDATLKACGSAIVNSVLGYGDNVTHELLVNTAGTCIEREIIRTSVHCHFVASDGTLMQQSGERFANRQGFELVRALEPERSTTRVARTAMRLLKAKRPPAGLFPVVFHPSVTGLLMHEALGHNAEADAVWAGESILVDKIGQKIASDKVNVYDDATYPDSYGSYEYDSEGVPAGKRVLIEKGVLVGYMHSLETAGKFGVAPNGSARAQDSMHRPVVRMSNTYMAGGSDNPANIFAGIDRGIYLRDGSWGYVFVDKGQFTCHASEAQMIEHGKLGEPLRDVSVSGMMLETLMDIEQVADDFEMDKPGMCGKAGQSAPVNCGGPHIRVSKLVVGGA